jgi:hypothetical protein
MDTKNEKQSPKTVFCTQYEQLLELCQNALSSWAKRREEAWQMGLRGKELGGELVRLQAEFAKSYAILSKHTRECPLCKVVSKIVNNNEEAQAPYLAAVHSSRPA